MVSVPSCPICEGRRPFCIHKSYPLPRIYSFEKKVKEKLSKDFYGPGYSVFVGHNFYPNVYAGPMIGMVDQPPSPGEWFGKDYTSIIETMSMSLRSKQRENVFSRSRFIEENQELALAYKAPDTEITFKKKPQFSFTLSEAVQPMGPSGMLEKMKITENVKVRSRVEKIVADDLKAVEQASMLYNKGEDVYKITTILSSGVLGIGDRRKLVPTRWGITATDDIVAKMLMSRIRSYPQVNDYFVHESEYMDNHFIILLMPGSWEFENFEAWAPGSNWSSQTQSRIIEEYEPFKGRASYAEKQAGGYYASRIGVVEELDGMRRQARVVVFREVSEGYTVPLGVWVVRETVRNAFKKAPRKFATRKEALEYIKPKLKLPIESYIMGSRILRQKRLSDF
jgi:hypothetical protein